ncbi:MAG TPA: hypothetical protein VLA67_08765 [Nitrospiraceae bacterium]|nr:hypothetical protein [Terriglobia bacterium]HSF67507.1 hypothetical protein [Nitrospiraceae bacterium]
MLEVHEKLLSLYSALIVAEQRTYERTHGQVRSTDELIQLLLSDPWFTWLCPLLDLLLRIDRLLDDDAFEITSINVENLLIEVRALTRPSFEGDGFERSYYEALHRSPEVLLAHFHITAYLAGKSRVIPPVATSPSLNRSPSFLRGRRISRHSPH